MKLIILNGLSIPTAPYNIKSWRICEELLSTYDGKSTNQIKRMDRVGT